MRLVTGLLDKRGEMCVGYRLDTGEVDRLLDQLDVGHTGHVDKAQFAASQIDWAVLQQNHSQWLHCVRRAFNEFDSDGDGVCSVDDIIKCLQTKLPLTEVSSCPFSTSLGRCVLSQRALLFKLSNFIVMLEKLKFCCTQGTYGPGQLDISIVVASCV